MYLVTNYPHALMTVLHQLAEMSDFSVFTLRGSWEPDTRLVSLRQVPESLDAPPDSGERAQPRILSFAHAS